MANYLPAPKNFRKTGASTTTLRFAWDLLEEEVRGYYFGYKKSGSTSSYTVRTLSASTSTHTITGLQNNTNYAVYVCAIPNPGSGYASGLNAILTAKTNAPSALTAPTGLAHDQVTSTSARVTWNAVTNASGYKVEYRRQGDTTWNE